MRKLAVAAFALLMLAACSDPPPKCPACGGSGKTTTVVRIEGVGLDNTCALCNGKGR